MITSLGIEKFWEHINEIERNIDAGTSFPPYNIIRHDMTKKTQPIEFAVAGYKKDDIEIVVHPHPQNYKVLEVTSDREPSGEEETSLRASEESLAASSALDSLSPKIGMSREHTAKTESFM